MALFFDAAWFDERLRARQASRDDLCALLDLPRQALDEVFKDQRELNRREVEALAAFLGVPAETVAERSGVSTPRPSQGWRTPNKAAPSPPSGTSPAQPGSLEARLDRIEQKLDAILIRLGGG